MKEKQKYKQLIICLAVPLAVGGLAGFLTGNSMAAFGQLEKPPLSPPGWLFPVVWTLLYLLMGLASWLVVTAETTQRRDSALRLYGLQLLVNFLWPFFFFLQGWYYPAFVLLVLLWYLVFETKRKFSEISVAAGWLMAPYLAWITFAGYLNLGVALLNR